MDNSRDNTSAHYLEIGKVKQSKKSGYVNRIQLTSFNLVWDDPCNGSSGSESDDSSHSNHSSDNESSS